jgi:hypothetical protein
VWSVLECGVSWAAGVAAAVVLSCSPLDRPCGDEALGAGLGSACAAAGAVLCVVGVACELDVEPCDAPGAVLCVVGVACELGAMPWDASGAVPCVVDGDVCDGGVVEVPDAGPGVLAPVPPLCVPVSACGAPPA